MKMDLTMIFDNTGLFAIGIVWMTIHALTINWSCKTNSSALFLFGCWQPSQCWRSSLCTYCCFSISSFVSSVGVLLAVLGYAIGTIAAIACTILMELAATTVLEIIIFDL